MVVQESKSVSELEKSEGQPHSTLRGVHTKRLKNTRKREREEERERREWDGWRERKWEEWRRGVWEEKVRFEKRTTGQTEEGKKNMKGPLEGEREKQRRQESERGGV